MFVVNPKINIINQLFAIYKNLVITTKCQFHNLGGYLLQRVRRLNLTTDKLCLAQLVHVTTVAQNNLNSATVMTKVGSWFHKRIKLTFFPTVSVIWRKDFDSMGKLSGSQFLIQYEFLQIHNAFTFKRTSTHNFFRC